MIISLLNGLSVLLEANVNAFFKSCFLSNLPAAVRQHLFMLPYCVNNIQGCGVLSVLWTPAPLGKTCVQFCDNFWLPSLSVFVNVSKHESVL